MLVLSIDSGSTFTVLFTTQRYFYLAKIASMPPSTNFCYRLIRESLIFATFSAVKMGVGLYVGRLIREYIRYLFIPEVDFDEHSRTCAHNSLNDSEKHTQTKRSCTNLLRKITLMQPVCSLNSASTQFMSK